MILKCIAVDDEPLALDIIEDYISKVPFLELMKTFTNAMECLDYLKNNTVDLLFLDIQMEELSGIQLLKVLKQKPDVIFTTAYDNFAIEGYELDVADYLLKPISFERFVRAADKVYDKVCSRLVRPISSEESGHGHKGDYFFVKTEFRLQRVNFDDILYVEGMGDYLRIHCKHEKIMTLQNFRNMENMLPEQAFLRVHRSFIVALDKIESIERNRIKIMNELIPIGENYKTSFFSVLNKKKLE
ncbi:MAG: LytTR family DNA-binding domain-containing protein [Bacteroidota bacterium]